MKPSRRRTLLYTALAAVVYVVVAVGLSWPLVLHLDERFLGDATHPGNQGDLFFTYNLQVQMIDGRWPNILHTDLLRHPEGMPIDARVAFSAHQIANVAFMTVFGLLASRNLTALLILVLNALTMHLLARERSKREWFAYVGGLLFAFGPYAFLKIDQGFFQKTTLFAVPMILLYLLRVMEGGRRRDAVLCVVWLLVMLAIYPPYAVFCVAFGGLLVLGQGLAERNLLTLLKRVGPLATAVVVSFGGVALAIRGDPRPTTMDISPQRYHLLGGFLDPLAPFRWYPYEHTFELPPCPIIPTMVLGLPILITALALFAVWAGVRYARVLALIAVALLVVMVGPYHAPDGDAEGALALPYYYLGQLPMASVLKFPIRLYPWVLIALMIAAGGGLRVIEGWLRKLWPRAALAVFPVVLAAVIVENRLMFPEYARFMITELDVPQFYDDTRDEEFEALLLLPVEPMTTNEYLVVPAISGRKLVNGYMDQYPPIRIPAPDRDGFAPPEFRQILQEEGVGYIVVFVPPEESDFMITAQEEGGQARVGPRRLRWLDRWLGPPRVYRSDGMAVYPVPGGRR